MKKRKNVCYEVITADKFETVIFFADDLSEMSKILKRPNRNITKSICNHCPTRIVLQGGEHIRAKIIRIILDDEAEG